MQQTLTILSTRTEYITMVDIIIEDYAKAVYDTIFQPGVKDDEGVVFTDFDTIKHNHPDLHYRCVKAAERVKTMLNESYNASKVAKRQSFRNNVKHDVSGA